MESFDRAIAVYTEGAVFTAFDIETTGLEPKRDRIVEFGAVKFDRRGLIARYSVLIDPGIPMPPEAGRVNGITDGMLAGQPPIGEVLPDFLRFIEGTVIVAHNAPFDCGFVNENLARLYRAGGVSFPALPNKIADTLLLARRIFAGREHYSLQSLASDLGIKTRTAHRALDDARLCMELFTHCCCKAASV
ncbi:MAG: 3'-5' exonuclease [Treponema sp.]|jgi:DNA polymerase-3 subunit epsilon|nr:3'-5' exonuclease [Treponema sp.]